MATKQIFHVKLDTSRVQNKVEFLYWMVSGILTVDYKVVCFSHDGSGISTEITEAPLLLLGFGVSARCAPGATDRSALVARHLRLLSSDAFCESPIGNCRRHGMNGCQTQIFTPV